MAIDTADRRSSAINLDLLGLRVLPTPDGTIGDADRLHLLGKYRAVGADDGGDGAGRPLYIPTWRRRRR